MPKLIRSIVGSFADNFQGVVNYGDRIQSVLKYNTDSIVLPNFIALIQNLNQSIFVETLNTSSYGIKQKTKQITVLRDGSEVNNSRYQTPIYIQNNNSAVRNTNLFTFSNSSSLYIIDLPEYYVSGATKIIPQTCSSDISGVNYNGMILSAITDCITTSNAIPCFNYITWELEVYTDNLLSYSNTILSSTNTANTITQNQVNIAVESALNNLNYSFISSGSTFTIYKPKSVNEIKIDLCVRVNIDDPCTISYSGCGCPSGYSVNPGNDGCYEMSSITATFNGTMSAVTKGPGNTNYGQYGGRFFSDITNLPFPLTSTSGTIYDASGNTVYNFALPNTLWGNGSSTTLGRLNKCGVWTSDGSNPTNQWIGFSYCLNIPSSGIYNIALAGDNEIRFKINGNLIVDMEDGGSDKNFKYWSVFPYNFSSGLNIIEMYGLNLGSVASFGAEIYSATTSQLTGMTNTTQLSAVTVFSTLNEVGQNFNLGTTLGYSCPTGYTLDMCSSGTPICTKITHTDFNICSYSGDCNDVCVILSDNTFTGLTTGSTGVYIITTGETINLDFIFTGNTDTFTDTDTSFKYEIYKYNNSSKIFPNESIYKSNSYNESLLYWNPNDRQYELEQSIPTSGLTLDGEYLIKGYYTFPICTEYMELLNIYDDTSYRKNGTQYNLYKEVLDYYFIAFKEAEIPQFSHTSNGNSIGQLMSYSLFPDTNGQTEFIVDTEITGDIIVALNGLTLSNGNDYTFTNNLITLNDSTVLTDVITVILVPSNTNNNGLTYNTYNITSSIVSGTTNNQGSNTVYFNTTTGKYELYSSVNINGDLILTLNGITLANNIDYYLSSSNKKRIILNGDIIVGDILTAYYQSNASYVGNIITNNPTVGFYISNPPQTTNGEFTIEVTNYSDTSFTSPIYTGTTPYIINKTDYLLPFIVSGEVGTKYIYRIKNEKKYITINESILNSINYSEVIPITIQSNAINSY